jgi:hypothetical protein
MPQELRPGVIPIPYLKFFLRITHFSETILSILTKLCPNVPWVILHVVSEKKIIKISANQRLLWPLAAMLDNRSQRK